MIKRNDLILIGVIVLLSLGVILFMNLNKSEGSKVLVTIDGKEYKTLDLLEDTTFTVETGNGGINTFVITEGSVDMIDANCPDKLCVKQRDIHYKSETIVCLPNKVVLEVTEGEEDDVDIIAN